MLRIWRNNGLRYDLHSYTESWHRVFWCTRFFYGKHDVALLAIPRLQPIILRYLTNLLKTMAVP